MLESHLVSRILLNVSSSRARLPIFGRPTCSFSAKLGLLPKIARLCTAPFSPPGSSCVLVLMPTSFMFDCFRLTGFHLERRFRLVKKLVYQLFAGKVWRNQVVQGLVEIGVWVATLDKGLLGQIVVAKMTRPPDRVGSIHARAMHQKRREKKHVALRSLNGNEILVRELVNLAETVDYFGSQEPEFVTAGNNFQCAKLYINVCERYPDHDGIKGSLHAPPILMGEDSPVHLFFRQQPAVEIEHRPRADVREFHSQCFSKRVLNPAVQRKTVQRNQVLDLFAAVHEFLQVALEILEQRRFEFRFARVVRVQDAMSEKLRKKDVFGVISHTFDLFLLKEARRQYKPVSPQFLNV